MGLDALVPLAVTVAIFLLLVDLMHRCPLPLPGLGNLLHVDFQNTPYCFDQLRHRFGDVFSLQLAWTPVVVLNGLAAVREALVTCGEDTADRPPAPIYQVLGIGPRSQGRPFRPNGLLNKAATNVIASLTCGRRFEYDDPRFLRLLDLVEEGLKEETGFLYEVLNTVPILLRIPGVAGKVLHSQKAFLTQLDELLTEHRMTWDPAQPPRDLTDAFLAEMEKAKGNPESSFNDENLRIVVADLFSAGMVTTSTTLAWGLLLMILHPDVQRRVQQEIDDVIGQVRRPEMGDQARMPYTTAVIHEVQRFGDIVPLNVPHMTSRDIEVQGFLIPKVGLGHFVKPEAFLPFSAGRRACLGEPLARMELFLFFTCLLHRFSFSVPTGQPRPSHSRVVGFLVTPPHYELCAVPR
uniref:Cytochrome P450 family 2 subfamily D member 6 n=1 Tax=Nomascus leucogenys TaxID=61853 RepID=A0A2I3H481_NOMLE